MFESKQVVDELYDRCCTMLDDIKLSCDMFTGSPRYSDYAECILFGCFCYYIAGCKTAGYATKVITKYCQGKVWQLDLSVAAAQKYIQRGYVITREVAERQMRQGVLDPVKIADVHAETILTELGWERTARNVNLLGGVVLLLFYAYLTGNKKIEMIAQMNLLKS